MMTYVFMVFACGLNFVGLLIYMIGTPRLTQLYAELKLKQKLILIAGTAAATMVVMYTRLYLILLLALEYAAVYIRAREKSEKYRSVAVRGLISLLFLLLIELAVSLQFYFHQIVLSDQQIQVICYLGMATAQSCLVILDEYRTVEPGFKKMLFMALEVRSVENLIWLVVCIRAAVFERDYMLLTGWFVFTIFMCYFVLFVVRFQVEERAKMEKRADIHVNTYEYYLHMEEEHLLIRKMYHEMKNQLMILQNDESGLTAANAKQVQTFEKKLDTLKQFYHTGFTSLDILLFDGKMKAESRGISFDAVISENCLDFMAEEDVNVIFSNAIINAIEACDKITEGEKTIRIKAGKNLDDILIYVKNTVAKDRTKGTLHTSKKNKHLHGIGMTSIQECAERYGGYVSIIEENDTFQLAILFNRGGQLKAMKKRTKNKLGSRFLTCLLFLLLLCSYSQTCFAKTDEVNFERDYLPRIFNSDNGLEGSAVKCLLSSEDGFIWAGSYTGLYRYDGTEFQKYLIDGRSVTVNDMLQDKNGTFWIGTNGEGLYRFDGEEFINYEAEQLPDGAGVINQLFLDAEGTLFAGTRDGLISVDPSDGERKVHYYEATRGMDFYDMEELDAGEKLLIRKTGEILLLEQEQDRVSPYSPELGSWKARCAVPDEKGNFYIGTSGSEILKVSREGKLQKVIDGDGLYSFNEIYGFENGKFWICSDNGIGLLQDDSVAKQHFLLSDSMEEACKDYQGNFWFASSRQGIMEIYENGFSDLGTYWGLHQTVNTIQKYGDAIYVGCDNGLFCYNGRKPVENELTAACSGERIRQIFKDKEGNLWVAGFKNGLYVLKNTGELITYNMENSGLTTNKIRCIRQCKDDSLLIGTEDGLFQKKGDEIRPLTDNKVLNSRRIMDVAEYDGLVYVATDGYGVYEVKNGTVENIYSRKQGLHSGIVMKLVPSENLQGVWLVGGDEICFIDHEKQIRHAAQIGIANSLDLILPGKGEAVILAGNGIFRIPEADLLKEEPHDYVHITKSNGLPVDFTANAGNTVDDGVLYLCGTMGVASVDLEGVPPKREVRLYLNTATIDGEPAEIRNGVIQIPANAVRITLDVRMIDYGRQNLCASYQLEGMDEREKWLGYDELQEISYTNLLGGTYSYHYKIYDNDRGDCIAETEIPLQKQYRFLEEPRVQMLIFLALLSAAGLFCLAVILLKEKALHKRYNVRLMQEKDAELAKLAYADLVTGAYNRNWFEQQKEKLSMDDVYAFFSVSVNHSDYLKSKYGNFYFEGVLRMAVETIRQCSPEPVDLYRVSENVFYFWFMKPVDLEAWILTLKDRFKDQSEDGAPLSLSVGAVYNNMVDKEKMGDLMERCEQMRLLDEKHAEAKFIEGKMKLL